MEKKVRKSRALFEKKRNWEEEERRGSEGEKTRARTKARGNPKARLEAGKGNFLGIGLQKQRRSTGKVAQRTEKEKQETACSQRTGGRQYQTSWIIGGMKRGHMLDRKKETEDLFDGGYQTKKTSSSSD